jgi:alpha-L-fucosidase
MSDMKKSPFGIVLFIISLLFTSCLHPSNPPEPYGPLPSANQLRWQEMEYFNLVCYGLNTYTGQEWGYGNVSPEIFDPSDLNADQRAKVAEGTTVGYKRILRFEVLTASKARLTLETDTPCLTLSDFRIYKAPDPAYGHAAGRDKSYLFLSHHTKN